MSQPKFKDLYSIVAEDYSKFRPKYPVEFFDWLAANTPGRKQALDVGTGNGQVAFDLAKRFDKVLGIDMSAEQLSFAAKAPNIEYKLTPADQSGLPDKSVDLLTVGQAFHWFPRDAFFAEVRRVVKSGGLFAVWTYAIFPSVEGINHVFHKFDKVMLKDYWVPERKTVDEGYPDLKFPFKEVPVPKLAMPGTWNFDQLIGYLRTLNAPKKYAEKTGKDPVDEIMGELRTAWGTAVTRQFDWVLTVRAFRL